MARISKRAFPAVGTRGNGAGTRGVVLAAWLLAPAGFAAEPATTGQPGQPPSVNKPVQRPAVPVKTGPQYVREPVVRPAGQSSPELERLRQQLRQTEKTLTTLQQKRDSIGALSQQDALQLQQTQERKSQLEARISDLLKQQADSTQNLIDNVK